MEEVKNVPTEVATQPVPPQSSFGKVNFFCGLVDHPGDFFFRLVTKDKKKILARTGVVKVSWSNISVQVPLLVETYSSDVTVRLISKDIRCSPTSASIYKSSIELIYLGPNFHTVYEGSSWFHSTVVFRTEVKNWRTDFPMKDVIIECTVFDKPGIYQVRLVGNKTVIAISPHIQVIWSSHYHLSVPQPYIFPCQEGVLTIYEYPPCILTEDRIRVYGRRLSSSTTDYIFETKVSTSKHALALPCGIFSSQYQSFCFTYTSVAASGAVFELKTFCRPRNIEQGRRRASWSGWSNWSRCSSTCGAGIRSRYRFCHSPSSASYCSGKSIESVVCVVKECIEETTLMTEDFLQHLECNCSCNLNITGNGTLVVKLLYCDHVPLFWTLKALPEGSLNIMFHEVNLDSQFWLTVREGASIVGPILAIVTNQMTSVFVNSHSSTVRIELQSSNVSIIPEGEITLKFFKENLKVSSLTADWNDTPGKAQFSSVHLTLGAMAFVVSCVILIMLLSKQIYSKFRQKHHSVSSESFSSSLCDIGVSIPKVHLLGGATSISELSCSPPSLRRQITTPKKVSSQENISPEDFLYNTFLFHSTSSIYTLTPPSSSLIQRRVLMSGSKKKLSVSPKPQPKSERASQVRRQLLKTARKDRPVDRLKEESVTPGGKGAAASTQSLSEVSVEGSEDGFEYDYYDYSCHNDPGSFFCTDPTLMGWPPFIPIYPGMSEEELPLRDFPIIQKETTDQDSGVS